MPDTAREVPGYTGIENPLWFVREDVNPTGHSILQFVDGRDKPVQDRFWEASRAMQTKRNRPEGGGFRWICVWVVGLEEDDAADLEQIPIVEALMDLASGSRAISRAGNARPGSTQASDWVVQ